MSTLPKDGGPAFPAPRLTETPGEFYHGMSLRDYFAGQALAALVTEYVAGNYRAGEVEDKDIPDAIAKDAYRVAKAMMAERAKRMYAERAK